MIQHSFRVRLSLWNVAVLAAVLLLVGALLAAAGDAARVLIVHIDVAAIGRARCSKLRMKRHSQQPALAMRLYFIDCY